MPRPLHAQRRWPPTTETLFVAAFGLLGLRLGLRPIGDNSMFVHLRTGLEMAAGHGIPRHDPYSFTASGTPWVVQSWLPELTYGWLHRLGGYHAVLLEQGLLYGALALVVATLARSGRTLATLAAAFTAIAIGVGYWSPRPLAVGLLCFAALLIVVERKRSPWWLVPLGWVWVNSHGSFPLGLAWLVALAVGEALDRRGWPRTAFRYITRFAAGLAVSMVNPLGPRLLAFPFTVLSHRSVFDTVIEWRAADFRGGRGLLVLAGLVAVVAMLARSRPHWTDLVPVAGFIALGLLAQRNLPLLGIVVAAPLARALVPTEASPSNDRGVVNVGFVAFMAATAVVFVVAALSADALSTDGYPVRAAAFLARQTLLAPTLRVVEQDTSGCYLLLTRPDVPVFIDDRVDMYPLRVSRDYKTLLDGRPRSLAVLDKWRADVVLWESRRPLATILRTSRTWTVVESSDGWSAFVRR